MSRLSEIQEHEKCDYDRCHCVPRADSAVVVEKSVFCSQGCADGIGCEHDECNCRRAASPPNE